MLHLKQSGSLDGIRGLIVGEMLEMGDSEPPFGMDTDEIVMDICGDLDIPVISNFPCGHGDYQVTLFCKETTAELETRVSVEGEVREKIGQPARYDVLREVAKLSRGEFIPYHEAEKLQDQILQLPPPEPTVRRRQIWASPIWAGTLIGIMGIFWVGRKMKGAI